MASSSSSLAAVLLLLVAGAGIASGAGSRCDTDTLPNGATYDTCADLPYLNAAIHWTYDAATGSLSIAYVAPPTASGGWVAWGINPTGSGMVGTQALVAFKQPSGAFAVSTYNVSSYNGIVKSALDFPATKLSAQLGADGKVRLFATLTVPKTLGPEVQTVWQAGGSVTNGVPDKHPFAAANLASKLKLDLSLPAGGLKLSGSAPAPAPASGALTPEAGGPSSPSAPSPKASAAGYGARVSFTSAATSLLVVLAAALL